MLTFVILILLAIAAYSGARRGLVLQIVYTVGYFLSFLAAEFFYQDLAPKLEMFIPYPSATQTSKMVFFDQTISLDLDKAFYAAVAFIIILVIGWLLTHFIGIFFNSLTFLPLVNQLNWLGGGLLSVIVMYVGIFILLSILTLVPLDLIQNQFKSSGLARWIVENTPILSNKIQDLWVTQILK